MKKINKNSIVVVTSILSLVIGIVSPMSAFAATSPSLGIDSTYGIVSSTYTNSLNAGTETTINGDVCYTTPPDTAPIAINGTTSTPCDAATGTAQTAALSDLNSQSCTSLGVNVVLSGTYTPGCYSSTGTMDIVATTTVTLSGAGTYIFRAGGALTTGANSKIALTNGASSTDVFWTPVGATTLGANSSTSATPTFYGNIFRGTADGLSITLGKFVNLEGRLLAFGSTVTTDSNTITVPTILRVVKTVVNNNGGTAVASDFNVHVKLSGTEVAGSPAVGVVSPGRAYTLAPETYVVSEDANADYAVTFSGSCNASGSVTLVRGDDKTCTLTNNDIAPSLTLNKILVNDNAGTAVVSDWTITATGPTTISGPGATGATDVVSGSTFSTGTYVLSESTGPSGYTASSWSCVKNGAAAVVGASIVLDLADTATCTITNDDVASGSPPPPPPPAPQGGGGRANSTITVVKQVINDNGQSALYSDFALFIDGNPVTSGQSTGFSAGTYTVTETNLPNYIATFGGDCDANGQITHGGPGTANSICTITNDDVGPSTSTPPVPPLIEVVKVPSPLSLPNGPGPVTYTYTLRNTGTVPVTDITMVGDTCSPIVLVSGDTDTDTELDVNETWIYSCSTTLSETHTNIITASGWANGISTSDVASATVVVGAPIEPPLIHVTKVPDHFTQVGAGNVVYTYNITNPGTVAMSNVAISDDKCGQIFFTSAGNGNNLLEPGEVWTFTCQKNLAQTTTNTVSVSGEANGFTATDFAIATVVVSAPAFTSTVVSAGFPDTGLPPKENGFALIVVLSGVLAIVSISLMTIVGKRAR